MNNLQLVHLIIYSTIFAHFIERSYCVEVKCDPDKAEVCFYKKFQKGYNAVRPTKVSQLPIEDTTFMLGCKLSLIAPPQFADNKDGNPFPLVKVEAYGDGGKNGKKRAIAVKIKNLNKDKQSTLEPNASILEGDRHHEWPDVVIAQSLSDQPLTDDQTFFLAAEFPVKKIGRLYYTKYAFPMNKYVNLFQNRFAIDIQFVRTSADLHNQPSVVEEDLFHNNLYPYYDMCKDIVLDGGKLGEQFRLEEMGKLSEAEKQKATSMKTAEFLQLSGQIQSVVRTCVQLKGRLVDDLQCFKSKNCESFMTLEKRQGNLYQFSFFLRSDYFLKVSLSSARDPGTKYEVTCKRYAKETEHTLLANNQTRPIDQAALKSFGSTNVLAYSTYNNYKNPETHFYYCGFFVPLYKQFTILDKTFELDFQNTTTLEVEMGRESSDGKLVRTWYTQTAFDLKFQEKATNYQKLSLSTIMTIVALVFAICLTISCYMVGKYQKLSQKLTEVGSRISNMDIISGLHSNVSNLKSGASGLKSNVKDRTKSKDKKENKDSKLSKGSKPSKGNKSDKANKKNINKSSYESDASTASKLSGVQSKKSKESKRESKKENKKKNKNLKNSQSSIKSASTAASSVTTTSSAGSPKASNAKPKEGDQKNKQKIHKSFGFKTKR